MDLLSSIRKSGSRGGVNFSWDEVQTSQHRENYLGHSVMAPVGRWQKGKDLSWYAKGDDKVGENGETAEDRRARERKEEIRKIKEAEEDALARALGLPVADRNVSGANAITVGEVNRMVKEVGVGEDEQEGERGAGFGEFVGNTEGSEAVDKVIGEHEKGGLVNKGKEGERDRDSRRKDRHKERRSSRERRHRHRSRSAERTRHRSRHRSRSRERHRVNHDKEDRGARDTRRNHSTERRDRRYRSRSPVGRTKERDDPGRERPRRSRSPASREYRRRRYS